MYLYFDRLYEVMDARKWNTIVYAFILNFYSSVADSKKRSGKIVEKRNTNLKSQVSDIS
jgi:hypothetical protein